MAGREAYMNPIAGGDPLSPRPQPPATRKWSDAMTYKLSPNLFVEHGAAVLARRAHTSAREFKLLEQLACNHQTQPLDRAA